MASRPSRSFCAPAVLVVALLFGVSVVVAAVGCGRKENPPAVAALPEIEQSKTEASQSLVEESEGAGKFIDDSKESKGATSKSLEYKPTTRSLTITGSSRSARKPDGSDGHFLSRRLLGGQFGFMGGRGEPAQAGAGGGQNVGQLFQGGGGVLGFGGGNGGMFGNGAADMSAEQYQRFEDNPFKLVRGEDALSTISTAVDTASYSNVRARINEGQLPAKDAVRIADFVNYFPYDYATTQNADPVAFKLELAPCPWQPTHHLLRVGLKAKVIDKNQMPARNLVFLIDTSGSMSEANRLPLVQESLRLLVEQLTGRDRVSIVTYAGEVSKLLAPTQGDQKRTIIESVNSLVAQGCTYGEGGIKAAYDQAEKSFLKDGINRVILATDGDFNVGVSNDAELVRLIEEKRKTGVYLTVLGYGMGNLQDSKLEQLAHHGNGHYAYIDSLDEAKKVFVEQGGALVIVAKDVKLQVEFNPAKVAGYRLIGYENRILRNEDFRNDAKDAGDMGSGHTCTALYEVVPVGEKVTAGEVEPLKYQTKTELTDAAKTGEWLTVRMRYKHPETEKASEVSSVLPANGLAKEASADLKFAGAAAAFGMVLRDSEYRGDAEYSKVIEWARPAIGADKGGHRAEFVRLVEKVQGIGQKKNQ